MDDQMHQTATASLSEQQFLLQSSSSPSLEVVFDSIEEGIFLYDALGQIVRTNRSARSLLGIENVSPSLSAPLPERIERFQVRDPAAGSLLREEQWPVRKLLRGETVRQFDVLVQTLDGRECIFRVNGVPLWTPGGELNGAVITLCDVTQVRSLDRQRHRIIDTLFQMAQITVQGVAPTSSVEAISSRQVARRLAELVRDLLGCQRVGLVEVEPQTQRQRPLAVVGLSKEQEQQWWDEFQQRDLLFGEGLPPALVERLSHQEILQFDLREAPWNTAPNPYGIVTMLLAPLCLDTRVVGLLSLDYGPAEHLYLPEEISLTQAVTQLLAIAIERERLQRTNARLTDLIALAHDAIIVRTLDGQILFWNHGAEQIYGWNVQQALGKSLHGLVRTRFPVSQSAVEAVLMQQERWEGVLVQTRKDGAIMTVESRKVLVREENQQPIAVFEINRDITERERLLEERAEAQANEQAARETSRLMEEFIGIAGHELRTPLTSIKANVQLVKRQMARMLQVPSSFSSQTVHVLQHMLQLLERTDRQIEMENRLISDLLDISRLHANQFELSVALCDLGALVREVVEDQRILSSTRVIHLSLPESEEVLVIGDRDRLRQVISNYLSNALKYSEAAAPIQVTLTRGTGEGRVEVRDQGPGLTPEEQQRIWTQFYRVKDIQVKHGSAVGLGLGLYICRAIIERQGGQVGVVSQVGVGSTFWFALPLADEPVAS